MRTCFQLNNVRNEDVVRFLVKQIVEERKESVIVVVSALGGITDRLIATANKAATGDETYTEDFQFICQRHYDVVNGLLDGEALSDVKLFISETLEELNNISPY